MTTGYDVPGDTGTLSMKRRIPIPPPEPPPPPRTPVEIEAPDPYAPAAAPPPPPPPPAPTTSRSTAYTPVGQTHDPEEVKTSQCFTPPSISRASMRVFSVSSEATVAYANRRSTSTTGVRSAKDTVEGDADGT